MDEYLIISIILGAINAISIVILVIITNKYARYTNSILKEQIDNNKKSEIRYELENVYSPMIDIIVKYQGILYKKTGNGQEYHDCFFKFLSEIEKINKNYRHITNSDLKFSFFHRKLQEEYKRYCIQDSLHYSLEIKQSDKDKINDIIKSMQKRLIDVMLVLGDEIEIKKKDLIY